MSLTAIYIRTSTREQSAGNQDRELRSWAGRLGFEITAAFSESTSGSRSDREALAAVLAGAHRREFDVLLIWSLDRLSREGIGATARYLEQLRAAGVRVMSHQEPWLDTGGPVGDLLVAIFAWVARQERERLGERVRAGLARARAQGVRFGRPARALDLEDVRRRRAAGQSWRAISRAIKVPGRTIRRRAKAGKNPRRKVPPRGRYLCPSPGPQKAGADRDVFGAGAQSRKRAGQGRTRGPLGDYRGTSRGPSRGPPSTTVARDGLISEVSCARAPQRVRPVDRTIPVARSPEPREGPPRDGP